MPLANCWRPPRNDPTVCPLTSGNLGSLSFFVLCFCKKSMAPPTRDPPFFSSTWTLPVAASAERSEGSPAYTPLTKGSISRSKASGPKLRVTNSRTDSSRSGMGSLMPMAPRPARILPGQVRKSPKTASAGPAGSGRNRPSHHTNLYELGSAKRMSSLSPTSHAVLRMGSPGWKELGPSSHRRPFADLVVMFPPTRSLASVMHMVAFGASFFIWMAADKPDTPLPTTTTSKTSDLALRWCL
mmetsp:Transcript_28623/g.52081  ORF Transcript_28623/g.52081 Transcript_28623/m.52081 type:complete len:241 (-) Transcript_28623:278-1000(-)